jgi:hypothetical protein
LRQLAALRWDHDFEAVPMTVRQFLQRVLTPVVLVLATLYFLIDAVFLSILKPIATRIARLPIFADLTAWVKSLGPYGSLALFIVPVLLLEPIKPIGAYLIGRRHFFVGLLLVILGELLKVVIVERLFHLNRDKLMSIGIFARCFNFVTQWLDYLRALPPWQAAQRWVQRIRALGRHMLHLLRRYLGAAD